MSRADHVAGYYRFHAPIYDLTRWTFLFHRRRAVEWTGLDGPPRRVLEVGCGTGINLVRLAHLWPHAEIVGVDLSGAMLARARARLAPFGDRVRLHEGAYGVDDTFTGWPDALLFSYSLTMMGEALPSVLDAARRDLAEGGRVIAVDFDDTPSRTFRHWMRANHVDVDGRVLRSLHDRFHTRRQETGQAFGGLWSTFLFAGSPRR
ncbi:MAG: methyltransferase domain-containing protein [Deltaproteobacteria bacterium]|nr:MAG: methyltransferase domain-containing protein [Deltaproteobacteria bacterium]